MDNKNSIVINNGNYILMIYNEKYNGKVWS